MTPGIAKDIHSDWNAKSSRGAVTKKQCVSKDKQRYLALLNEVMSAGCFNQISLWQLCAWHQLDGSPKLVSLRTLSASLSHRLSSSEEWQRPSTLVRTPSCLAPQELSGFGEKRKPKYAQPTAASPGLGDDASIPCSFSQQGIPPAFWPGQCFVLCDCPTLQGAHNL